jgi:hypothetical protein
MPLFEHCSASGVHTPVQSPPTHAWLAHEARGCHVPLASHVCGTWPTHCFAPGLHVPEQAPPLHTFTQTVPSTHFPVESHVCGVRFEHRFVPGEQTPMHAPPPQA